MEGENLRRLAFQFEQFGPFDRNACSTCRQLPTDRAIVGTGTTQNRMILQAQALLSPPRMTKTITLSLALAIVVGSIAFLHRPITHASVRSNFSDMTCGDQYNALLIKAKQSLARGDRAGAIGGLVEAQNQLRHCEELEERNAKAPSRVALNSF